MRGCPCPRESGEENFCKVVYFFFSPVRSPLGKAYVSSRVDTDTLLPCHLVVRLTRGEKKETLKGNARGVVSLLSGV